MGNTLTLKYKHRTKVAPHKTAAEIMKLLSLLGATTIQTEFEGNGDVSGMRFQVTFAGRELCYRMPIRWKPLFEKLKEEKLSNVRARTDGKWQRDLEDKARRIAWRIALEWLKVNMSMMETGARDAQEVFLSDLIVSADGHTLGDMALEGGLQKLLTS